MEKNNSSERPEVYALRQEGGDWLISRRDFLKAAGLGAEKGLQLKTLRWIAKTAEDPDCVKVLCSHDPNVGNGATYEL